ncbi:hypothetical protein Tco_0319974 [Tanacetum coccineum]
MYFTTVLKSTRTGPKFRSEFPNQDMKEEFPGWFGSQIHQRYIDKDPGVSASRELLALACGPTITPPDGAWTEYMSEGQQGAGCGGVRWRWLVTAEEGGGEMVFVVMAAVAARRW